MDSLALAGAMEIELAKLYKAYKKSGKSITHFNNSGAFKDREEKFYSAQASCLGMSLLKKRKAVMATDKDLEEAASKLQGE